MPVLYGDFAEGRPRKPIRSNNGHFGEIRMYQRRRFKDSSVTRWVKGPVGQEESESGDNDNTGLDPDELEEILEELRIG